METINDRMEMLVNQRFDGNKAAFAKIIDMPPTSMSSYLGTKRRSKPSVDMVAKIVLALDVDARWLLTGEAERMPVSCGHHNQINDHGSHDNINGEGDAVLRERVKSLEALVAEKERLIKVLMKGYETKRE